MAPVPYPAAQNISNGTGAATYPEELWMRFDYINSKLTGLCHQIHAAHSVDERKKFEERVGVLQLQRVEVARKIKWASRR